MHSDHTIGFQQLEFRAQIDFVTIATPGKVDLPALLGTPKWNAESSYRYLTIHDPRPEDVARLTPVFPQPQIIEVEIAVDAVPVRRVTGENDREALATAMHGWVARHLYPFDGPYMRDAVVQAYAPELHRVVRFNYRCPQPQWQLLYGHRDDLVQVKGYVKKLDQGQPVERRRRGMRVEVALRGMLCAHHGLNTLEDLVGFRYRSRLLPYLRAVGQPFPVSKRTTMPVIKVVNRRRESERSKIISRVWPKLGVQGIRGVQELGPLWFPRDQVWNARVGKALHRLQESFSRAEFVRMRFFDGLEPAVLARLLEGCIRGRITYKDKSPLKALLPSSRSTPSVTIQL
jgi:hypothetical protein